MASFFNHGTVIEGAYKGDFVYGLYEKQLHLFDTTSIKSWKYNSGQTKPNAVIDSNTVESIEIVQEREKGVEAADVGGATLLLGPIMGAAMYADGKKKQFYVKVCFKDGSRSLMKIEPELYDIVQRIKFELPNKNSIVDNENKKDIIDNKAKKAPIVKQKTQPLNSININPNNIEPTITRIELFLEDKEWNKVKAYAEAGLDYFPTDYRLYLYLLFADMKVSDFNELKQCSESFSNNPNYNKVIRFADGEIAERLKLYSIEKDKEKEYNKARRLAEKNDYKKACVAFLALGDYKDSKVMAQKCAAAAKKAKERIEEKKAERKNEKKRIIAEKERKRDDFLRLITEHKELVKEMDNCESGRRGSVLERIDNLEERILVLSGIIRNTNNSYSFTNYNPDIKSSEGKQIFECSNEWQVIARTGKAILLLCRHSVKTGVYSGKKECDWTNSEIFKDLNLGRKVNDIVVPPLFNGFSDIHRTPIGKMVLLSIEEVEKYLPDKTSRILYSKSISPQPLEWFLMDGVKTNMVPLVNQSGDIIRVKNSTLLVTYKAAIRPAVWVDIEKLIPLASDDNTINSSDNSIVNNFDSSQFGHIEHEGFSFLLPIWYMDLKTWTDGETLKIAGAMRIRPSETDPINSNVDRNSIITEETIELENGKLHLLCSGYEGEVAKVEIYFDAPDDKVGLYAVALDIPVSMIDDHYKKLRKGFLCIKKI